MSSNRIRDFSFRAGYAVLAVLLVAVGLRFLLGPWNILPELTQGAVARASGDVDFLHVIHEAGAALIALGLGSGWCAVNLQTSRPVHLVLAFAFTAIALVHWFDVRPEVPTGIIAVLGWGMPAAVLVSSYFVHPARSAA